MAITQSIKNLQTLAETDVPMKTIKGIYSKSKDGFVSSVDLSKLANIVDATLVNKGIVQLQTEINDSETTAATPKAVNTVKAIADANTAKITEIETAIDSALEGEGSLAEKLADIAFVSKANEFTEAQTLLAKDAAGTDTTGLNIKTTKFTGATGQFEPGTSAVDTAIELKDSADTALAGVELKIQESGRDASLSVTDNAGTAHGIRVHLDKAGTAESAVAYAPSTPSGSVAQEIVTADFLKSQLDSISEAIDPATDVEHGIVKLSDAPSEELDAATGGTAATPKAVFDVDTKVNALTATLGTSGENAALLNAENTFTQNQNIQASGVSGTETAHVSYKLGQFTQSTGVFTDDSFTSGSAGSAVLDVTGAKIAENLTIVDNNMVKSGVTLFNADGSASGSLSLTFDRTGNKFVATAPSTASDASGSEIVTADFVNAKLEGMQDNLVDASDSQRGLTLLSDATDSDLDAESGKTAATPKAVKTVKDSVDALSAVIGANAENAALVNSANTFTEAQTFQQDINVSGSVVKTSSFSAESGSAVAEGLATQVKGADGNVLAQIVATAGDLSTNTKRETFLDVQNAGASLGKLGIASDDGVTVYTYAPTPGEGAKDTEIVTVKYMRDHIGDLQPEDVAYVDVNNTFTEAQTLQLKTSDTTSATALVGKASNFETVAGSFDDTATVAKFEQKLVDKNDAAIASVSAETDVTSTKAALSVFDKNGANAKGIEVSYDRASEVVTATAPETASDASGSEIATAKFVGDKVLEAKTEVSTALQRVTNVVGADAENAALKNAENIFTAVQKFQSDDKILNLGGEGISTEGTEDDALVLGASYSGSGAEIVIAANGSIMRSELPVDPEELEVATVGYVKSIIDISGSLHAGSWSIAFKDYTQVENQADMEEGVFYGVSFNKAGQYIQIDPETGKPSTTQAPEVVDTTVHHFVVMYKAPSSGAVVNLGERDVAPDFDDVPLLSKDNTFTGTNTFTEAKKATPSVEPTLSDVNDNAFITKSEFINYFNAHAPLINFVTQEPSAEEMVVGQVYYLIADEETQA